MILKFKNLSVLVKMREGVGVGENDLAFIEIKSYIPQGWDRQVMSWPFREIAKTKLTCNWKSKIQSQHAISLCTLTVEQYNKDIIHDGLDELSSVQQNSIICYG